MPSLKARLRITEKCLKNCWYCYVPKNGREMSLDTAVLIRNKLKEIFDRGNYSRVKIALTGGDPILNPNFLEISKLFLDTFQKINIMTDVCSTSNFEVVKKFVDLGGRYVVSLNEDPIKDVIEVAKFAKKKKVLNYLNVLLIPFNIDRLDEILNVLVVKNDINIRFNHLYNSSDSSEFRQRILPAIEKIGKFLVDHNYKYYNYLMGMINLDKTRNSYCGYGNEFYFFDTDSSVHRCNEGPKVCNITDDIEKCIKCNTEVSDKCKNCEDYKYCLGGCFYSNEGNGEFCKEYSSIIRTMKQLKMNRTISGWKSYKDIDNWLKENFVYDIERLKYCKSQGLLKNYQPIKLSEETFDSKSGICMDSVLFSKEVLNKIDPTYKAEVVWLKCRPEYSYDHCVCKFELNGEIFIMDYGNFDLNKHLNGILGPYKSLDEYKKFYEANNFYGKKVKNIHFGWPHYRQKQFES